MKKITGLKYLIFTVLMFFCGALFNVFAVGLKHTDSFYINDFANVLSSETKDYIFNHSRTLDEKTTAQLVVVTTKSLDDMSEAEYALNLGREWGVGSSEKKNGCIILLAPNERKIRIEIGDGLEGRINDAKAGRLIDEYALSHFKNNDWDKGILGLYSAVISEIYAEYNLEAPEEVSETASFHSVADEAFSLTESVIYILIIAFFGVAFFISYRRRKIYGYSGYDNHDDWYNGPGGFGGFGGFGGSSGGGFSGGGGSFSGGGASRSF